LVNVEDARKYEIEQRGGRSHIASMIHGVDESTSPVLLRHHLEAAGSDVANAVSKTVAV
jgi:hypothetical protein